MSKKIFRVDLKHVIHSISPDISQIDVGNCVGHCLTAYNDGRGTRTRRGSTIHRIRDVYSIKPRCVVDQWRSVDWLYTYPDFHVNEPFIIDSCRCAHSHC